MASPESLPQDLIAWLVRLPLHQQLGGAALLVVLGLVLLLPRGTWRRLFREPGPPDAFAEWNRRAREREARLDADRRESR